MSTILLAALFLLSFLYVSVRNVKRPPGPGWVPFLGSLPYLTLQRGIHDWFLDRNVIKHKISTVFIFRTELFVINDFDLAKDLFGRAEFSGRHVSSFQIENLFPKNEPVGIIFNSGANWMIQRRFSLKTLKDFGFGRQNLEVAINAEIDILIQDFLLRSRENCDVKISSDFNIPIVNILWQMVAGHRLEKEDSKVKNEAEIFQDGMMIHFLPLPILKLFPHLTGYRRRKEIIRERREFFLSEITDHQQSLNRSEPTDFIDVYLIEMEKNNSLSVDNLVRIMEDFLGAGTETSATTLKWILLYLTLNPSVQERCRREIESVLGTEGRCEMSHLVSLPYTMATITEVQRVAMVAPMTLLHSLNKRTVVEEYTYPAGSLFTVNLSWITNDPSNFEDPSDFNPLRWLGPDGKFVKNDKMVPFGIGKRICMGELLARNELFLFTVNLLQKIRFLPPENNPTPNKENYNASMTRIPDDFYLRMDSCRNQT